MWSVGAIAYLMMTGYMPITGKNTEETIEKARKGIFDTTIASFRTLSP